MASATRAAHFHYNWAHDENRKLVLNALVWVSGLEVPCCGVVSTTATLEQIEANQDEATPDGYAENWRPQIEELLDSWNAEPATTE